jgi:hypothetical protein
MRDANTMYEDRETRLDGAGWDDVAGSADGARFEECEPIAPDDRLIYRIASIWEKQMPESFDAAQEHYIQTVDPFVSHALLPRETDARVTNMLFIEWLVYDYCAEGDWSPFEYYVEALDKIGDAHVVHGLRQVAKSQFFSEFWVLRQFPDQGVGLIKDAFSGQVYALHDKTLAVNASWNDGLLGMRIACVNDVWMQVGIAPMHDNLPKRLLLADDRLALFEVHPEGKTQAANGRGIDFLAFARQLVGADGGYLASLELRRLEG